MHDDRFLPDDMVAALRMLLATEGPNREIQEMLENDRAKRVAWKRVEADVPVTAKPAEPELRAGISSPPVEIAEPIATPALRAPDRTTPAFPLPAAALVEGAAAKIGHKASRELREILGKLIGALHPHATKKLTHEEVRKWVWAINAVLTAREEIAPCVRPQPKLGRKVSAREMTETEKLMLNDRQMFDLEFAHKHRLGQPKRKWEALLRSDMFNPMLAATFIKTVGSPDRKVDALGLRDDEQMLLAAIRSEKIKKRWERINKNAGALADQLRGAIATGASRMLPEAVESWVEEYIALEVADGRPAQASRLLHVLFARDRPANQLANRKADLRAKGFSVD